MILYTIYVASEYNAYSSKVLECHKYIMHYTT